MLAFFAVGFFCSLFFCSLPSILARSELEQVQELAHPTLTLHNEPFFALQDLQGSTKSASLQ